MVVREGIRSLRQRNDDPGSRRTAPDSGQMGCLGTGADYLKRGGVNFSGGLLRCSGWFSGEFGGVGMVKKW